jgi:hypothetical protein
MKREHWKLVTVMILLAVMMCAATYARKGRDKGRRAPRAEAVQPTEAERQVTETEVPEAALAALKKLAAGAEITEFAEEIEYGHTFYEGSWKSASGANMDVLVTTTGDLMEIEEQLSIDNVPAAALKVAKKAAGKKTELASEKKTMILYEFRFQKEGSQQELLLTPDGRRFNEDAAFGKGKTKSKMKGKTKSKMKGKTKGAEEGDEDEKDEGK